jgi:hypothetical protein
VEHYIERLRVQKKESTKHPKKFSLKEKALLSY